jgi:YHS domain-containing protein
VQGPDPYLHDMEATFPCAVNPDQPAIIDASHRAFVNHEVYYFGSDDALRAFVEEPWRYAGRVTDPVSLERFAPTRDSLRRSHGGRLFFLASAANAAAFDAEPATYGVPRPMMHAKK